MLGNQKRLLCILLITLFGFASSAHAQDLLVGKQAPAWTLQDSSNQSVDFPSDFAGRPTVVLFWASWCPYCARLMPYLVQIEQDYGTHGVTVLALNFKEDADPLAHLEERGLDLRVFLDADSVAEAWGIRFSPGLLVVDGNGVVVYQRRSTDKPPGKAIAGYWSDQVRDALDGLIVEVTP